MKIAIRDKGIRLSTVEKSLLEDRLHFALARFADRVQGVSVYLSDENARKGGVDKACRMVATLPGQQPVVIQDQDANLLSMLGRAADRLGRTIARRLEIERMIRPSGRRIMSISLAPELREAEQ